MKKYLYLKRGDRLKVGDLELVLSSLSTAGHAIASLNGTLINLGIGQYTPLGNGIGIFNYGRKHTGQRIHIHVELPPGDRYILERRKDRERRNY